MIKIIQPSNKGEEMTKMNQPVFIYVNEMESSRWVMILQANWRNFYQ